MNNFDSAKNEFDKWTARLCAERARMVPVGRIPPEPHVVHVTSAEMVDAFLIQHPYHEPYREALVQHAKQVRSTENGEYVLDSQVWNRTKSHRNANT
jgi:hypothetical protein